VIKDLVAKHKEAPLAPRSDKLGSGLGGPEDKSRSRRHRAGKHDNALKHGAFATMIVLPWEDPEEFRILHTALIAEWNPVGPTEQDAVFSIAKGMWRKRRMQLFFDNDMQRCSVYPDHGAYHEAHALRSFCESLESSADKPENVEFAFRLLSVKNRDHLRRKFPRHDFQSISEWIRAIQNEVTSVLLPEAERFDRSVPVLISRDARFFTQEVVKHELAVDERIDAMIDRAVKRLVQAKTYKQMLGSISQMEERSIRKQQTVDQPNPTFKNQAAGRDKLTKPAATRT
jgi:hypothetical protein